MEIPSKVSGQIPQITVLLSNSHGKDYKNFRCTVCGKVVFSYNNERVRMILPSGKPETATPSQVVRCNGTITLHTQKQLYDILFAVIDEVYAPGDINSVRDRVSELATEYNNQYHTKCKAEYYIS